MDALDPRIGWTTKRLLTGIMDGLLNQLAPAMKSSADQSASGWPTFSGRVARAMWEDSRRRCLLTVGHFWLARSSLLRLEQVSAALEVLRMTGQISMGTLPTLW